MNNTSPKENNIGFVLDGASGVPVYRQIISQIENAILSQKLKAGDRLPTIRALAVELKINPNTIAKVYNELEIRGIVVTQVGSGTYISDKRLEPVEDSRSRKINEVVERFLKEMENLGAGRDEIIERLQRGKTGETQ